MEQRERRIVVSSPAINNKGSKIPNEVVDFESRFRGNPVGFKNHNWDDDSICTWKDWRIEDVRGKQCWTAVPVFHEITEDSKKYKKMYDAGVLRSASLGGFSSYKTDYMGQELLDEDGAKVSTGFEVFEISLPSVQANPDATQVEPLILTAADAEDLDIGPRYLEVDELGHLNERLTVLSAKYNNKPLEMKNNGTETVVDPLDEETQEEKTAKETLAAAQKKREELKAAKVKETQGAEELPEFMKKITKTNNSTLASLAGAIASGIKTFFSGEDGEAPPITDQPRTKKPGKDTGPEQPNPVGLAAEKAAAEKREKLEKAKARASEATEKLRGAKEKAEKGDATEDDVENYKAMAKECDAAMKDCEAAEKDCNDAVDDSEEMKAEKAKKEKEAHAAKQAELLAAQEAAAKVAAAGGSKPALKTLEQMKAEFTTLAPKPESTSKVIRDYAGKTFSQLRASTDANDERLLARVLAPQEAGSLATLQEAQVLLSSMMIDPKFRNVMSRARFASNVSDREAEAIRLSPAYGRSQGLFTTPEQFMAQFQSGGVEYFGADRTVRKMTTLSSSDAALASPALNAIAFLSLIFFKLFPSGEWKSQVPVLAPEIMPDNTGVIWGNIMTQPTIYVGNQPVSPADYLPADNAVSMALVPYWMQPLRFTPLTMHQLRYDQESSGIAQAFATMNSFIDDKLIYALLSLVPQSSIVQTSGVPSNPTPATASPYFNIAGATSPDAFAFSPNFTGYLTKPVLNDVSTLEQILYKQNFKLKDEKQLMVVDPTMYKYLTQDPDTKSLLTRWVGDGDDKLLQYQNTRFIMRSQVGAWNPAVGATPGAVLDPYGVVPNTAISIALGFIASQIALGIGLLDVFQVQDPTNYGMRISADVRMGAAAMWYAARGMTAYTYAAGQIPA
jgi:hypothetical protein